MDHAIRTVHSDDCAEFLHQLRSLVMNLAPTRRDHYPAISQAFANFFVGMLPMDCELLPGLQALIPLLPVASQPLTSRLTIAAYINDLLSFAAQTPAHDHGLPPLNPCDSDLYAPSIPAGAICDSSHHLLV